MSHDKIDKEKVIGILNKILEYELAGVARYTHYSFMVYGYHRIPIASWFKSQAQESLDHAFEAGELITALGGHPSLGIGPLLETFQHQMDDILKESLENEKSVLGFYYDLLEVTKDKSVMFEEYARTMIATEEKHLDEVNKMLRKPGDTEPFQA